MLSFECATFVVSIMDVKNQSKILIDTGLSSNLLQQVVNNISESLQQIWLIWFVLHIIIPQRNQDTSKLLSTSTWVQWRALEFRPVSQRYPNASLSSGASWKGCFFRETELGHGDDIAAQNEHKTKTNVGTSIWACEHGRPDGYLSPTWRPGRCEGISLHYTL